MNVHTHKFCVTCFLDRCFKRKYTSKTLNVRDLMERQDKKIFKKVSNLHNHPLRSLVPHAKTTKYNLRKKSSLFPNINTNRFKNSFINRLIFKYDLAILDIV